MPLFMESPPADISQVIQLAVAPVFLLAGIGAFVNAFAGRLARVVDRSRHLESGMQALGDHNARAAAYRELDTLRRRARLAYLGIALATLSALLVCLLIVFAFLDHFLALDTPEIVGGLFVGAMLSLIGALVAFLREVFLAVRNLALLRGKKEE
jgi:MFS family permease